MRATLTEKQPAFVREYLIDLNATAAYRRAGYAARGNAAEVNASRLLRNAKVAAAISAAQAERAARVGLTADEVLRELAILGRSSHTDYAIDDTGNVTLAAGVSASAHRAVSSIKRKVRVTESDGRTETTYETEIKLWSKPDALRMAGQHLGLFKEAAGGGPAVNVQVVMGVDESRLLGSTPNGPHAR